MDLVAGFYIINNSGTIRCKEVTYGKPGSPDRRTVVEATRYRTIAAAKDICEALGTGHAVLYVGEEGFVWGE